MFHCADKFGFLADPYYESIDLIDAFHPQTILAYEMNDVRLPVPHGAPLRLRLERQLGYKMAKYVMRIEAVASFAGLGEGKGGFWATSVTVVRRHLIPPPPGCRTTAYVFTRTGR